MTYQSMNPDDGTTFFDMPRFAADLARELGASVMPQTMNDGRSSATLHLGGADELELYYGHKRRVHVVIRATDVPWQDRRTCYDRDRAPDAYIDPAKRSIQAIAADIKRRVIDAAQDALASQRAFAAQQTANRRGILEHIATVKAHCPGVSVRHDDGSQTAGLYLNHDDAYFSGTLHHDGRVHVERVGMLSADKFRKLIELLNS